MKFNLKKYIIFSFFSLFLFLSFFGVINATTGGTIENTTKGISMEGTGIVPVCYEIKNGVKTDVPCENFADLVNALKGVINFAVKFVLAFSVVIIAYSGWNYMTSGSNPGKRADANKMLVSVLKGIFFILAAWLIVTLIMNALVSPKILQILKN